MSYYWLQIPVYLIKFRYKSTKLAQKNPGWHGFYFLFHIWDVILPIDELILFKMVIAPPTSYNML